MPPGRPAVEPGATRGPVADGGRAALLLLVLAIALQAAVQGTITNSIDPTGSLLFSSVAFITAAIAFTATDLLRGRHRPSSRPRIPWRQTWAPMAAMNVATAAAFLGFYVSLSLIPAATTSALEAAFGPACVLLLARALTGQTTPVTPLQLVLVTALGLTGLALAWRTLSTGPDQLSPATLLGLGLGLSAGAGMAGVVLLSRQLGRQGASPVTVTAHRFHLTYLLAIPLWLTRDPDLPSAADLAGLVALGLVAVAVPLFLLQVALQRVEPVTAVAVAVTLPGMTYLVQLATGGTHDTPTLLLLCLIMAIAAAYATTSTARGPGPHQLVPAPEVSPPATDHR